LGYHRVMHRLFYPILSDYLLLMILPRFFPGAASLPTVRRPDSLLPHLLAALLSLFATAAHAQPDSTNGWGYPLDSLDADLARWRLHPEMRVDSIGLSAQGRPIWRVTVGEEQGVVKPRVFVHARTHPAEVQSF